MNDRSTVAGLLAEAKQAGVDRLDARMLLARALARPVSWMLAHGDAPVDSAAVTALRAEFARRAAGEPLAYLLGEWEFHGLRLRVDPKVLVPRPDTELLVDWALELLAAGGARSGDGAGGDRKGDAIRPDVIDLGTGSGAIAIAVRHAYPAARMFATDASAAALDVARANAARLRVPVEFAAGSWWEAAGDRRFDLALSNPPYIAGADPHLPALRHEPLLALTPGGDGLGALRDIVDGAPGHLRRDAWLLLEHGFDQAGAVRALLAAAGFGAVETRIDLGGNPRCTGGRWAAP